MNKYAVAVVASATIISALASRGNAQQSSIVPDQSLGAETSLVLQSPQPNTQLVVGGARRGRNLFHSFLKFNVPEATTTLFNSTDTANIIVRMTGAESSFIGGTLGSVNPANLFIINPSGISFGRNANVLVNGSFLATTGSQLNFSDGSSFGNNLAQSSLSSANPSSISLESIGGKIVIEGLGHEIRQAGNIFVPNTGVGQSTSGIRVTPGSDITVVANDIEINGGLLTAPSGSIRVLAINDGQFNLLDQVKPDLSTQDTGNITFTQQSLLDSSGAPGGNIDILGQNITFTDGSLAIISNLSSDPAGSLNVHSDGILTINGLTSFNNEVGGNLISRGLVSQTFTGQGADISITANSVTADQSSGVIASTFGSGQGGSISFNTDGLNILGGSPFGTNSLGSLVLTTTVGEGKAGDIEVSSGALNIRDGGFLISAVFGPGAGGNVNVQADQIQIDGGINLEALGQGFVPSTLGTTNISSGDGGDTTVLAEDILITNGGRIDSSTLSSGDTGIIDIQTTNLTVNGSFPGSSDPLSSSAISSSASLVGPFLSLTFGLPNTLSGDAGNISVMAEQINISDGARVTVQNDGSGVGGEAILQSTALFLDNQAFVAASTASGTGGNVFINSDLVRLLNASQITSSASGSGPGGNIVLTSDFLISDASFIRADAEQAIGGAIAINTQGIFLSPTAEITATSELGESFSGTIDITTPNLDLQRGSTAIEVSNEPTDVATVCNSTGRENELTFAGTGGSPSSVEDYTSSRLKYYAQGKVSGDPLIYSDPITGKKEKIERAVGWKLSKDGKRFSLVADAEQSVQYQAARTACLKNQQPV